jgi:hypothetical protein
MLAIVEKEALVARPPTVAKTTTIAGFDLDRVFTKNLRGAGSSI